MAGLRQTSRGLRRRSRSRRRTAAAPSSCGSRERRTAGYPTYPDLVRDLADRGLLTGRWRQVFEAVPRSRFVPAEVWRQPPDRCEPVVGTDARLALVNSDEPVVTQLDDGAEGGPGIATSSNSMPSMVARILKLLDVEDGQRALEIGTGTGFVSALLCERLGDDLVHSVELDPVVARQAAEALAQSGYRPHLRVGDGEQPVARPGAGGPADRHLRLAVRPVHAAAAGPSRRDRCGPAGPGVLVGRTRPASGAGGRHCIRPVLRRGHVHADALPPRPPTSTKLAGKGRARAAGSGPPPNSSISGSPCTPGLGCPAYGSSTKTPTKASRCG